MTEYTAMSYGEVRFIWNRVGQNPIVDIYHNVHPKKHIYISIRYQNLKDILKTKINEDTYSSFKLSVDANKIYFEGLEHDMRKKKYKAPIAFKRDDLVNVIKMIEEERK